MAECVHCGAAIGKDSRFCPQCGREVAEATQPQPRTYGVTPSVLVLVLVVAAAAGAVVLFVLGQWPVALVLVGVALLLLALFAEAARRRPAGPKTRASAEALHHARARAGGAADSVATRGRAMTRVLALRRALKRLASQRARILYELGDAVYRGDDQAIDTARGRLIELDRQMASTEAQMHDVVAAAQDRIEARRLESRATHIIAPTVEQPSEAGHEPQPQIPEERS